MEKFVRSGDKGEEPQIFSWEQNKKKDSHIGDQFKTLRNRSEHKKKKKRKRERGKEKKYWGFCISVHLAQIHSSHPVQGQVTSSATSKLSNPQLSKKKFKWVDQLPYL